MDSCLNDTVAIEYFGRLLFRQSFRMNLVGDKTSTLLSVVKEIFALPTDEMELPDLSYNPVNVFGFSQLAAKKMLNKVYSSDSSNLAPFVFTDSGEVVFFVQVQHFTSMFGKI